MVSGLGSSKAKRLHLGKAFLMLSTLLCLVPGGLQYWQNTPEPRLLPPAAPHHHHSSTEQINSFTGAEPSLLNPLGLGPGYFCVDLM